MQSYHVKKQLSKEYFNKFSSASTDCTVLPLIVSVFQVLSPALQNIYRLLNIIGYRASKVNAVAVQNPLFYLPIVFLSHVMDLYINKPNIMKSCWWQKKSVYPNNLTGNKRSALVFFLEYKGPCKFLLPATSTIMVYNRIRSVHHG